MILDHPPEEAEIMSSQAPAFKIKAVNLPVLQLHIFTTDMAQLKHELALRLSQTPDFFASTPIVLELTGIAVDDAVLDFSALTAFMREHGMCPAGVSGGSEQQRNAAAGSGLGLFPTTPARTAGTAELRAPGMTPADVIEVPEIQPLQTQPELPGIVERTAVQAVVPPTETLAQTVSVIRPTMVIDRPVRTGQTIYAEGANLVLLAIANAGSELIADGDIHVYAPLRGKAIAGAHGNEAARIFVHKMEAELLSIAGCFKVFEDGVPENVRGKAAQIHLQGTRLEIQPLSI
ncbi:MAG: septum site-determining protein MinC [Motiliproteus sp.]|jgi:septum site-determining protein MinC